MNPCLKPASVARIVELARTHCTAEQWGEWLRVPVEHAASEGDKELVRELLGAGARGDPFEAAIRADQYDFLEHLFPMKAKFPGCFLRLAVSLGNEPIVSLLLNRGAHPDAEEDYWVPRTSLTPLLVAAKAGHAGIVGLLLDAGASAHYRIEREEKVDEDAWDPTYVTIIAESALDLAAVGGHVDVIKAITQREPSLVNGAVPRPTSGYTPLHLAAKHGQVGSIDALVEAGADLEAQAGANGGTALHVAVESPDCEATVGSLLGHGADMQSMRRGNVTPLDWAIEAHNVAAVNTLAAAGADVTSCLLVGRAGYMADNLIRLGADVNLRRASDGNTPLHLAARCCSGNWVDTLLKAGGDETAVNDKGELPVDLVDRWSSSFRCFEVDKVRALLANAPRDRADRAWSRRGFLVLCRSFPSRVRLQLKISQGEANDGCSPRHGASDGPSIDGAMKKRAATGEAGGGDEEQRAGSQTAVEGPPAFRASMARLLELEADVVFRKIVKFL